MLIKNENLTCKFHEKGAELTSLKFKNTEILWEGDPAFWAKHSPILFPIIGTLKNDQYIFDGENFSLSRHGFARDNIFKMVKNSGKEIVFKLENSPKTLQNYPFKFCFLVKYEVVKNSLITTFYVKNEDEKTMYFSLGAHPAFKIPIWSGENFEDYSLQFFGKNGVKNSLKYRLLNENGLVGNKIYKLKLHEKKIEM